jgi:carbohydrate-selective porin OprB
VQPDLQIITTPGAGSEGSLGTAVVGILRVNLLF